MKKIKISGIFLIFLFASINGLICNILELHGLYLILYSGITGLLFGWFFGKKILFKKDVDK